jgi:carbon storage regulator
MLILCRRKGGRIMIGDDIVITIIETRSDRVKIGIAAPNDVPVHREEVYQKIHEAVLGATPKMLLATDVAEPESEI